MQWTMKTCKKVCFLSLLCCCAVNVINSANVECLKMERVFSVLMLQSSVNSPLSNYIFSLINLIHISLPFRSDLISINDYLSWFLWSVPMQQCTKSLKRRFLSGYSIVLVLTFHFFPSFSPFHLNFSVLFSLQILRRKPVDNAAEFKILLTDAQNALKSILPLLPVTQPLETTGFLSKPGPMVNSFWFNLLILISNLTFTLISLP